MQPINAKTLEELAAQRRGAAGQDLFQDLALPPRQGRTKPLQIFGRPAPEQFMDAQALTTVAGGQVHQRSLMKSSSRF